MPPCGVALIATVASAQTPAKPSAPAPAKERVLKPEDSAVLAKKWTGDFDGMVERSSRAGINNVELIAAEKIGRETVTYVSNIYKY